MRSSSDVEVVRARPALGTIVTIRVTGARRGRALDSIARAFGRITEVERAMSFHCATSELSRVNRSRPGAAIRVSGVTYSVLELARTMFAASDGIFDPSIAPTLSKNDLLPRVSGHPSSRSTFADLELLPRRRVRCRRPLHIDLGGIAKGYAVDLAIESLRAEGITSASVNAGGDLRVFGPVAQTVHVRHPRVPTMVVPILRLRDGAVATTASYFSRRRAKGRLVSAIVSPSTRRTVTRRASISVVASTCAVADALTKVVYLAGDASRPVIRRFDASAAIVMQSGTVRVLNDDAA